MVSKTDAPAIRTAQSASPATVPLIAIATKDDVSLHRTLIPASLRASPRLSQTKAPKRRQSPPPQPNCARWSPSPFPPGPRKRVNHKRSWRKCAGILCRIAALIDRVAVVQQRAQTGHGRPAHRQGAGNTLPALATERRQLANDDRDEIYELLRVSVTNATASSRRRFTSRSPSLAKSMMCIARASRVASA